MNFQNRFTPNLLGIIELLLVDVEKGLVEGALHGVLRNAADIFLHALPLSQSPGCRRGHDGHLLSRGVISQSPALTGHLIQPCPGGRGERGERERGEEDK